MRKMKKEQNENIYNEIIFVLCFYHNRNKKLLAVTEKKNCEKNRYHFMDNRS